MTRGGRSFSRITLVSQPSIQSGIHPRTGRVAHGRCPPDKLTRGRIMPADPKQIFVDALALPAVERAALIEDLLASLDRPDPTIDGLWAREAKDRIAAFE